MDLTLLIHLVDQDAAGVAAVDHDRDVGLDALCPFLQQSLFKTRVGRFEVGDDLAHVGPLDLNDFLAAGQIAHKRRDVDGSHEFGKKRYGDSILRSRIGREIVELTRFNGHVTSCV